MRRVAAVAVLVAAMGSTGAHADPAVFEGDITAPNPLSRVIGGITELQNPCGQPDPDLGDLKGVDGVWVTLPAGVGGQTAKLEASQTGLDLDIWFYSAGCGLLLEEDDPQAESMTELGVANEEGIVPGAAAYAIVDLVAGARAHFKLTIG